MNKGMHIQIGQKYCQLRAFYTFGALVRHWIKYQHDEQQTKQIVIKFNLFPNLEALHRERHVGWQDTTPAN